MRRTAFFLSILTGLILSTSVVWAQFDSVPVEEATRIEAEQGQIGDTSAIDRARETYIASVEQYRESEQQYIISQEQYYQLNTVASLDDAIRRGKEVLRLRVVTLRNYNTYLDESLRATTGVDLNDKSQALNDLASLQQQLTQSEIGYNALTQRAEVDAAFVQLNEQKRAIESISYRVQTLIKIGELQTAIDTAQGVNEAMGQQLAKAQISAADRAIKERGLREAAQLLESSQTSTFALLQEYRQRANSNYSSSNYEGFIDSADGTYLLLRQAFAYMQEVLKGIE